MAGSWAADVLEAAARMCIWRILLGVVMFSASAGQNDRRDETNPRYSLCGWVDSQKLGSPRRSCESSGSWGVIGPCRRRHASGAPAAGARGAGWR